MRRAIRNHRSRGQTVVRVSLLPFLAVLICTMGTLILLLVVVAREARVQAEEVARTKAISNEAEAAERQEELQDNVEMAQWRIEQLQASRKATEGDLAEERLKLGHIEDDYRRLRAELVRTKRTLEELDGQQDDGGQQRGELLAEVQRLQAAVVDAGRRLDEAARAAGERRRSYAVIPYRGPHQTSRRPIYIECRADAVVLQPEGIVLRSEDFDEPLGPGNPLAAALRAIREYLLMHGGFDPQRDEEPYPLLLVRPDGIHAYSVARQAMESWKSEFGYELIGEDWKLEFGASDPGIAAVAQQAVETARAHRERLAAIAPSLYRKSRERPRFTVTAGPGGAVPYGGSHGGNPGGSSRGGKSETFGGGAGRGGDASQGGDAGQGGEASQGGGVAQGGATAPDGQAGQTGADERNDSGGQIGSPGGETPWREGTVAGRPPREQPPGGTPGTAMRPGEWIPHNAAAKTGQPAPQAKSLADNRGEGWALPGAAAGSVPLEQPIRVECHADRLEILSERGARRRATIALGPQTEDSIDEFVSAVWEQIESWGIAGRAMHWQPILNVRIAPDAEHRFTELQALLDGSGLKVRRK
ncbi:MAG: hypothetical protein HQ567_19595 [Candidatus Nealsonbacteria bacterium]|nr:hypothetical protein [Candidatus Nealsonbacteria bacterium]